MQLKKSNTSRALIPNAVADPHGNRRGPSTRPTAARPSCCSPVTERLVTAALVRGRTGLTVRVVAALLVTRLGVVAT